MFGGEHFDKKGNYELLNDVWIYSPRSNQWKLLSPSNCVDVLVDHKSLIGAEVLVIGCILLLFGSLIIIKRFG